MSADTVPTSAEPNDTPHEPTPPPPAPRRSRAGLAVAAALLALLVGAIGFGIYRDRARANDAAAEAGPWADTESPVPVSSEDPVRGSRIAPLTLVLFGDLQDPNCANVQPTLEELRQRFGNDLRFVWKHTPLDLHDKALPASVAAQAVFQLGGSAAFWKFHDAAFAHQADFGPESFEKWATEAGVDAAAFKQALTAAPTTKKVEDDRALAKTVGVRGTPTFFLNGIKVEGAPKADKFGELMERERRKANALVGAGTAKTWVYVERSKINFKTPEAGEQGGPQVQQINGSEGEIVDAGPDDVASKDRYRIPVGTSPALGKREAPVTVIAMLDYECPYCKQARDMLRKLRETYGDKVRVVMKQLPVSHVHPRAEPASELALEARAQQGDKGFWEAHDRIFDSAPKLADADLEKIAEDMKLDVGKVKTAIKDKTHAKEIEEDLALARAYNCNGTPHFFVNGRRVVGMHRPEVYGMLVDDELKTYEAQKAKAKGVAFYEYILKDAKLPEPPPEQPSEEGPPGTMPPGQAPPGAMLPGHAPPPAP